MATGSGIGSAIGGLVGSLYGPLGTAAGSAIGTAAGTALSSIPALIKTDAEKENEKRLAQLKRMQEMGTLGLTESEKQSLYGAQQSQIANQLQQGQQIARSAGAAGMASGAGTEQLRAVQAAEANAGLAANAARQIEMQNLQRKRELEDEMQSRIAAKTQYELNRTQAVSNIAAGGVGGFIQKFGQEQNIKGQKPSPLEIQQFSKLHNMSPEQSMSFMTYFSQRPDILSAPEPYIKYWNMLNSDTQDTSTSGGK